MSEFDELFGDEFFVFDSENLDSVTEKFYGYMVTEKGIVQNENLNPNVELTGIGAYLWVKVHDDTIKIIQDFNGSWELYMYCCENNDYFAISNSYIKLLEYLKGKARLTINKDYANSFLFIDLTSYFYEGTLINEIKYVPRNCEIIIDKKSKTILYDEIDYEENSIDLNSEKGLKTLDGWFEKWVSIVRLIKSKTNNISFDLTGGFDSRVVATIWLSANLNFDKLYVNTIIGTSKQFIRDLKVSSEISNCLKFPLNKNTIASSEKEFDDIFTLILISFYIKLGFHKKIFSGNFQYDEPIYNMGGGGGESVREYANKTCSEFIDGRIYFLKDKGEEVCDSSNRIFHESFSKLLEKFPNVDRNSKDLPRLLYNEVRSRHHMGKGHIEHYFNNKFVLSPLLDPELRKLKLTADECGDRNLLYALIFTRYYPELLNFDFEKNKKIDEDTINYAKRINVKYPYIKKQYSYIEGPELDYTIDDESTINNELGNGEFSNIIFNFIQKIFNSRFYEFEFKKYYPSRFYDVLYNELNDKHSPNNVIASLAILLSINYTSDNPLDLKSWLESFLKKPLIEDSIQKKSSNEQYLKIYETARIDIIKEGESQNKIEILENTDNLSKVRFPKQFNKNGSAGCLISSDKGELNLKIRCVGDGKLKIFLKTLGLKDKNNTTFPIYIDYFKLNVNDKEYLDENKLLCHDDRFHITLDVRDSEILNIYIKWLPYNESSVYTDKIKILKNRVMKLKDENAKIKKENKQLKMNAVDKC